MSLIVYTTSSAVNGSPCWNVTPSRRVKSIVVASTCFHDVAKAGLIVMVTGSRYTRQSKAWNATTMPVRCELWYGSTSGMASRQVMRSVSADFCASAGTAVASVMQAASSAPRSQVSDRIYLSFQFRNANDSATDAGKKQPACHRLGCGPLPSPAVFTEAVARPLSPVDGREQPFQEAVDGFRIDPANYGHKIMLPVDIDHVGAVADMRKCGGPSARPALPVGVHKPVH